LPPERGNFAEAFPPAIEEIASGRIDSCGSASWAGGRTEKAMGDIVPQVLILTSWISNCLARRKEKKMGKETYKDADNLLFFRPVDETDLPRIIELEVRRRSAESGNRSHPHARGTQVMLDFRESPTKSYMSGDFAFTVWSFYDAVCLDEVEK